MLLWAVMSSGLGMIALFATYYVLAMTRERRRAARAAAEREAALGAPDDVPPVSEPKPSTPYWELDARLENAPIGTVEYLPMGNGGAIGAPPDLPEHHRPRRGNPRLARIAEARQLRFGDDRRSLLRRS
jgi:hypothetical protein